MVRKNEQFTGQICTKLFGYIKNRIKSFLASSGSCCLWLTFSNSFILKVFSYVDRERSGSVVECLTRDRRAAGSSLTGVTALCP